MNLINYNQVIEALDRERQLLLNREQYGAENVLVHHAINVIAELPIIRQPEIVRCKDCRFRQSRVSRIIDGKECNLCEMVKGYKPADWYCADGEKK